MRKVTLRQRLQYRFDNTMSKGTPALIAWLGLASVALILGFALLVLIMGVGPNDGQQHDFISYLWLSLLSTIDSGNLGNLGLGSPPFLLAMLGVTIGGIFIVSALIGILTTGLNNRIERLRKGRSFVVEGGHTLILGWSEQVYTILHELSVANENQRNPCVVILADRDKIEMEDMIHEKVGRTGKTRVVCRTGSPIDPGDLEIVNHQGARSIIVLSPAGDDPDSQVIKTVLAITNGPHRRTAPYHIIAEIHDPKNMEAAKLVGGDEATFVDVGDTISRLIAQTCRQSGLSVVYTELLDFEGDEIYFQEEPALVGKTFGEALLAYEDSAAIGIYQAGRALLNPPMDTLIGVGDSIIAVSEDDDTVKLSQIAPQVDEGALAVVDPPTAKPERILILGWNRRAPAILRELDNYVARASAVMVVAEDVTAQEEVSCAELKNTTVAFQQGDTTDRQTLDGLSVESYDHVIVLCYSEQLDPQRADARTLITLLHLRDIESHSERDFSIVSEMLDDRNRQLAEVTRADDFIVSDKVLSLLMSQLSENRHLSRVFADLFDAEGSEIYLKPACNYVQPGREVNFYTVVESARRRNEVAIGYRVQEQANDQSKQYGVVVNPDKSKTITFAQADKVIVLAES